MNTASAASANRQELYGFIDMLPERSIPAVRSLLEMLSEDYWKPVIETDLTKEEIEMLREDREHRKNHPEDYVPLEEAEKIIFGKKNI
ncbi:hypothetical protein AGMMS50229_17040 [Campylobacterota bacterium]|nr:hypothetical protein AGMMS50229_17040 [Campylobacterota bacterium]